MRSRFLDRADVPLEQLEGVVVDVVRAVGTKVAVRMAVGPRRIEEGRGARHAAGEVEQRTEQVRILHGQTRRAATAHAVPLDAPASAGGDRAVAAVDVRNQFADDEGLAHEAPVVGVLVERPLATVGHHHHDRRPTVGANAGIEHRHLVEPMQFIVASTVQVVDHRVAPTDACRVTRRPIDAVADLGVVYCRMERAMRDAVRQRADRGPIDPDR